MLAEYGGYRVPITLTKRDDKMTIVFFHIGNVCEHIDYVCYTKEEILKFAKKYALEKGYVMIVIPKYGLILNRHGTRWYQ